jgi:hypothetical protein
MRETFWYFEYTAEQLEQIQEQSRLAQGGVSIQFEQPEAYGGQILQYDDGGTDGSRLTNPTPINQTPTDAGFIDISLLLGVASSDQTSILGLEPGTLRIEQHPSIYGTPLRIKFTCELTNGSVPADGSIINSTPYIWQNSLYVEVALKLSPDSTITQEQLIQKLDSITYGGNYIMITSIASVSSSPLVAFKTLTEYNTSGQLFHDLCVESKTYITTAGNPNAQLESGLPYIEGTFEQGRLLSISLIDITDRDTTFPYSFQWFRETLNNGSYNTVAIENATSIIYTVSSNDVGKNIITAITYINNAGDAVQKNSPPVFIINNLPTADLTIDAESYRVGNLVTANIARVRDRNGVASTGNYRWQRSNLVPLVSNLPWVATWTDIANSDSTNYTITEQDQQRRIRFAIDVTDSLGDVKTLTSENSQVINTSPQGTVYIGGTPTVGSSIYTVKNFTTPDVYDWTVKQRTYTWFRNGIEIPNSSKIGNSYNQYINYYTVDSEDFGSQITVSVTYTDDRGYEETLTSAAVSIIGSNATGLDISGVNEVSGTLSADLSDFVDPDITSQTFYTDSDGQTKTAPVGKPVPTEIEYRWKLVEDDLFLTQEGNEYSSLLVSGSYYGKTIELSIKYPDPLTDGGVKTSATQTTIVNSLPTGEIVLTGSVVGVRLPLTLSVDQVSDINGPYQEENADWDFNYSLSVRQRNAFNNLQNEVAIENASGTMKGNQTVVYTVSPEYQNSRIIATVTYVDGEGVQHTLTDNIEIPPVGYPEIIGTFEEGQILSIDLSDVENYVSTDSIKWYRYSGTEFEEISGETSNTYTVSSVDVEKYIMVEISYTTNASDQETRSSLPILVVNSNPVGVPRISNSGSLYAQGFAVGDVLSASVEHIVDANGIQELFDYQWYTQTNSHIWTTSFYYEDKTNLSDVSGETNTTYTIREEDQLKRIGYKVKLRDGLNKIHELNSGLSWRKVDHQPTGFIRVKRQSDNNIVSAGIDDYLTVDYSQLIDLDGIGTTRNHIWKVDGQVVQQGSLDLYLVKSEDYGKQVTLDVSYNDRTNQDRRDFTSTNTFSIVNTPPSGLYLRGTPVAGTTLVSDISFISDPQGTPSAEEFSYQWFRDDVSISDQQNNQYTVLRSDYGKTIKLEAYYTDLLGNQETAEKSVIIGQSVPSGSIILTSNLQVGSSITIDPSQISDVYGPETQEEKDATLFSYVLYKYNDAIAVDAIAIQQGDIYGNQTDTYQLKQEDLGGVIFATATFLDGKGDQKTVDSIFKFVNENGDLVDLGNSATVPYPPDEYVDPNIDEDGQLETISSYEGPLVATGAGVKTVKLLSNYYIITYQPNGFDPDIQNYTLTATANNHVEPIYYKFYRLSSNGSDVLLQQGPNDTPTTRTIVSSYQFVSNVTYRVDTIEGSQDGDVIATDVVVIYGVKE